MHNPKQNTFIKISFDILNRTDITPTQKLIYGYLMTRSGIEGWTFNASDISAQLGLSYKTAQRELKKLEKTNQVKCIGYTKTLHHSYKKYVIVNLDTKSTSNLGQNDLSNLGQNDLSNLGQNDLSNLGQNDLLQEVKIKEVKIKEVKIKEVKIKDQKIKEVIKEEIDQNNIEYSNNTGNSIISPELSDEEFFEKNKLEWFSKRNQSLPLKPGQYIHNPWGLV